MFEFIENEAIGQDVYFPPDTVRLFIDKDGELIGRWQKGGCIDRRMGDEEILTLIDKNPELKAPFEEIARKQVAKKAKIRESTKNYIEFLDSEKTRKILETNPAEYFEMLMREIKAFRSLLNFDKNPVFVINGNTAIGNEIVNNSDSVTITIDDNGRLIGIWSRNHREKYFIGDGEMLTLTATYPELEPIFAEVARKQLLANADYWKRIRKEGLSKLFDPFSIEELIGSDPEDFLKLCQRGAEFASRLLEENIKTSAQFSLDK